MESRRLIVDGETLQGQAHLKGNEGSEHPLEPGRRLAGFLTLVQSAGFESEIAGTHLASALADADLFVVPTRSRIPYTTLERNAVQDFSDRGGGIWIMSNHAPYHEENRPLAALFGIGLEGTFFHTPGKVTEIGPDFMNLSHPLWAGPEDLWPLVTNTTDSILPGPAEVLVRFPSGLTDRRAHPLPSQGRVFAAALNRGLGLGRVVVTADSGMFADSGTSYPGHGLLDEGANQAFVRKVLAWLSPGRTASRG
jgi:hypothetical protein